MWICFRTNESHAVDQLPTRSTISIAELTLTFPTGSRHTRLPIPIPMPTHIRTHRTGLLWLLFCSTGMVPIPSLLSDASRCNAMRCFQFRETSVSRGPSFPPCSSSTKQWSSIGIVPLWCSGSKGQFLVAPLWSARLSLRKRAMYRESVQTIKEASKHCMHDANANANANPYCTPIASLSIVPRHLPVLSLRLFVFLMLLTAPYTVLYSIFRRSDDQMAAYVHLNTTPPSSSVSEAMPSVVTL